MDLIRFLKDLSISLEDCLGASDVGGVIRTRDTLDAFILTNENKCKTILFAESFRILSRFEERVVAGMKRRFYGGCDYVFNLLVLEASSAELQYHDETQFYDISESRWERYIAPKLDCLGCLDLDLCELLGDGYELVKWNVIPEHDVSSNFFDGVKVEVIIRRYASTR